MALSNEIFSVTRDAFEYQDDIEGIQDEYYTPNADPSTFNTPGNPLVFNISGTDKYYLPSEARLEIQGQLLRGIDNAAYADTANIAFQNNGPLYLFSSASYQLGNKTLEIFPNVGQSVTMHKLLTDSHYKYLSSGISQMSCKDVRTATDAVVDLELNNDAGFKLRHDYVIDPQSAAGDKGKFSFTIPLTDIFGFMDFYKKIIYNQPQTITFNRAANDNDALFRYGAATAPSVTGDGKVKITYMRIYMPSVRPSIRYMEDFKKNAQLNKPFPMPYRMRTCDMFVIPQSTTFTQTLNTQGADGTPMFVVVGFQTDRLNQQLKNGGYFDNLSVNQAYATLNGAYYPLSPYSANSENFSYVYNDAVKFAK